ncbi:hypothetical protein JOF56_009632 [Kibdelosporangium banguiense]|uniref:Uncharacterized protein n=1 Tax=Kibdelosporangium banguiense TaxID=1365924 RepID=A0ABS4TXW4_9PSEU|nr:hypothetical protein [Kibdelosporangium banguiense]MBP2329247.1 hypothetical protein [Kibdelosporangium banguiense]
MDGELSLPVGSFFGVLRGRVDAEVEGRLAEVVAELGVAGVVLDVLDRDGAAGAALLRDSEGGVAVSTL